MILRTNKIPLAALLVAVGLLLSSEASAYHGAIFKPEFRGWRRDGTGCVLIKRIVTSEGVDFEELLEASLAGGKLVVERHGLYEAKQRPDYMDEYDGPALSESAAEDRIRRLGLQEGSNLSPRAEGDRTWIPIPSKPPESREIGIQVVPVMEGEDDNLISYTAFERVWLEESLLMKSSHKGWDEGNLPTAKVVLANLSPNRKNLLVIVQIEGYSSWFEIFFIDLVGKVAVKEELSPN